MAPDATLALRDKLAGGHVSAAEVTEGYLSRIAEAEAAIGAWAWHDPDFARAQAEAMDKHRRSGRPVGPLHGLPVGVKDIVDTARIPTAYGLEAERDRVPAADAVLVERLKRAGAVVMGKTVTTELAFMRPSDTRNPHDRDRTPGGSSAGSAAAVAASMVPFAVGTQTGGSVIRPASFCGVAGYKPTFAAIPTKGVLPQSPSLDTVGVMAASPAACALLADVLIGPAEGGPPTPHPRLSDVVARGAPVPPTFAVIRPPGWDRAAPGADDALRELVDALGDQAFEADLPDAFAQADPARRTVNFAEMARCYAGFAKRGVLSDITRAAYDEGAAISARDYLAALDWRDVLNAALNAVFERCDAILCPAALGPAPGPETTGDPVMQGLWTFCGVPAVTVPILTVDGMPFGVQLVGPRHGDARLLRTAQWLFDWVDGEGDAA